MAKNKKTYKYPTRYYIEVPNDNIYAAGGILGSLASSAKGLVGGGANGILGGIASGVSGAISGGMSTGVGGAMQTIGGLASNIPGIGGVIGAGVNVLGGLVNRAFGSQINEQFVSDTNIKAAEAANQQFDNSSIDSVIQQQTDQVDMGRVTKSQVGKDGWFSNKAKNLTAKLNKQIGAVNAVNKEKLGLALEGADEMQNLDLMANFAAYGGQLFKNGGGIHIKKANRGKFTEYCGGKVTSECIARGKRSSSPAVRKRATFAQNARGWSHADGGSLILDDINYNEWRKQLPSRLQDDFDYNLRGAYNAGYNATGDEHLPTRDERTGEILKKPFHPTYLIGLMEDARLGYYPYTKDGKTHTDTWEGNKKAFGGWLGTQGGDFSNGITIVGNGGTHEENPFEGVQMGVDQEGNPNLVEEGEVVFNDYVFSNRTKLPKRVKKELRLNGKTFADGAKQVQKISAERPNDPISNRTVNIGMAKLAEAQEVIRQRKASRSNRFADGGPKRQYRNIDVPMAGINTDYSSQLPTRLSLPEGVVPIEEQMPDNQLAPTWMRYAPVVGAGLGVISDAFRDTDYSDADRISSSYGSTPPVGFTPVSNRLTYNPLDTNYMINRLDANTAAQRRSLIDTSGGNRATAAANIIAANANYGNQMGDLFRQAQEYNQQQRERVEGFNRQTNMYNSEGRFRADAANQQSRQADNERRLRAASAAAQMRQSISNTDRARRDANITGLLQGLGDIGYENFNVNMINTNPALYRGVNSDGSSYYKGSNKKKKGGRIVR